MISTVQILSLLLLSLFFLAVFFVIQWIRALFQIKKIESNALLLEQQYQILQQEKQASKNWAKVVVDSIEQSGVEKREYDQKALGYLLNPFAEKLKQLQDKVEHSYHQESIERASLKGEVGRLYLLNQELSQEAHALVKALKGDSQIQGHWGETVLEGILEKCGLRAGFEFEVQESHLIEGKRLRPDVVVHLPQERYVVIDSKVSIKAYQEAVNASSPDLAKDHIKEHVKSIRRHVHDLSQKDYKKIYAQRHLDFVLLFIPIEGAFSLAIHEDSELFQYAYDKGVLFVSPTTIAISLRTIANLWRGERQQKNAQEIAELGHRVYEKMCSASEGLFQVDQTLEKAQLEYKKVLRLLFEGKGNLMDRAQQLRALGVHSEKKMPSRAMDFKQSQDEKNVEI